MGSNVHVLVANCSRVWTQARLLIGHPPLFLAFIGREELTILACQLTQMPTIKRIFYAEEFLLSASSRQILLRSVQQFEMGAGGMALRYKVLKIIIFYQISLSQLPNRAAVVFLLQVLN